VVSIPKHVQDFLPGKLAWVATASLDGEPNVTPKGSLKLLDEHHVLFARSVFLKTRKNLEENTKVAVTVMDASTGKAYQLKKSPKQLPPLRHVLKITVQAVFDQSVGPDAGEQIA
jgi:hypothetical protein